MSGNNIQSIQHVRRAVLTRLREQGVDGADIEARELICEALGLSVNALILNADETLSTEQLAIIEALVARRLSGEPLDHILGFREFYGRRFAVNQEVLSPRADSEAVIIECLARLDGVDRPCLLDLGTGSGALLATLLAECPDANGIGIDLSEAALVIARSNIKALGLSDRAKLMRSHWMEGVGSGEVFDLIVSNPPYITDEAMERLSPEVRNFDPDVALSGGKDGLAAYRSILARVADYLKPQGWLVFEIGFDQGAAVSDLLASAGFVEISVKKDLGGNDRVVSGQFAGSATITA